MANILLNDKKFYKWLHDKNNINNYLKSIQDHQQKKDYIIRLNKKYHDLSSDRIIEKLSLQVPRKYFQELLFCAKTFSVIMGTVFPPLLPSIDQLLYIEWLLYIEPDYTKYRDHLVHMLKVAYVGTQLLSENDLIAKAIESQFKSKHFKNWCKERKINSSFTNQEKIEVIKIAFFLAAIFHDIGYGHFFQNKYRERLGALYTWLPLESDFTTIYSEFYKKLDNSLACRFIKSKHQGILKNSELQNRRNQIAASGFFRDCLYLNHSISSAFTLLSITERFKEAGALDNNLYIAFQIAVEAIMLHDMTNRNNWLYLNSKNEKHFLNKNSFNSIPIAILLILADELSCWNRFKIKSKAGIGNDEITFKMDKKNVPEIIKITFDHKTKSITISEKMKEIEQNIKNIKELFFNYKVWFI